jgi:hypothetical protein
MITGIYDGSLSGGNPKGIEVYALCDISDLSVFGVGSANNGGGSDGLEYTFPADAVTAGTFFYASAQSSASDFTSFFGFAPTYFGVSALGINGDDAVELYQDGNLIDAFGEVDGDADTGGWSYQDG